MRKVPDSLERKVRKALVLSGSASPEANSDFAVCDWEDLLSAIKVRLTRTAVDWLAATSAERLDRGPDPSQASVHECVAALDQLHTTLRHELARRDALEQRLTELQAALDQTRGELLGIRADEQQARHMARHDSLTSLPNRSFISERLERTLARSVATEQPLVVLYLDLDHFKPINDTHGHDTGDALLRIIASRLTSALRAGDVVSRVGGDEFACVLDHAPSREALNHLARQLIDAVSAPAQIGPLTLSVKPSIGIAICPHDGASAEALLKNADTAMYHAKRRRVGYAFFDDSTSLAASTQQ